MNPSRESRQPGGPSNAALFMCGACECSWVGWLSLLAWLSAVCFTCRRSYTAVLNQLNRMPCPAPTPTCFRAFLLPLPQALAYIPAAQAHLQDVICRWTIAYT